MLQQNEIHLIPLGKIKIIVNFMPMNGQTKQSSRMHSMVTVKNKKNPIFSISFKPVRVKNTSIII